jgi:glycine betaine/choline ABC-type transport system substrate-binding protein
LVSGEIDLYPEYTGTALLNVVKSDSKGMAAEIHQRVQTFYRDRFDIEWLTPLGFNNTFAMVVKPQAGIRTLSDASARKMPWKLGMGYEFETRPDGLRGLQEGQVDMIAASATDGLIAARDLQVLDDDRNYFPPYQAAIAVRRDALEQWPRARAALDELAGRFSDEMMRRLNYSVDGEHRSVESVAREWLQGLGR